MSNIKNKKNIARLELSDDDLATIYFLLSDFVEGLHEFRATPGRNSNDLIQIDHDLQVFLPIKQKLDNFFKDANIVPLSDKTHESYLAKYDLEIKL